jgi:hypothetical protein
VVAILVIIAESGNRHTQLADRVLKKEFHPSGTPTILEVLICGVIIGRGNCSFLKGDSRKPPQTWAQTCRHTRDKAHGLRPDQDGGR